MGWTVRDGIPVGTRFSARPDRPWGPPSLLYNGYVPGLSRGKVRPGRAADHSPPSSAAVMEEYSYTSTQPLGHTRPVTGSLYLYLYLYCVGMVGFTHRPLYLRVQEAGWVPEPVWAFWRRHSFVTLLGVQTRLLETCSRCILHRLFCPDSRIGTSSLLNKSSLKRDLGWRETRLHRKMNRGTRSVGGVPV